MCVPVAQWYTATAILHNCNAVLTHVCTAVVVCSFMLANHIVHGATCAGPAYELVVSMHPACCSAWTCAALVLAGPLLDMPQT